VLLDPAVPPLLVPAQVVPGGECVGDVPGLVDGVPDALRRHRVRVDPGVTQQRPAGAGRRTTVAAHHRLGHDDERRDPLRRVQQPGVEDRRELPQPLVVAPLPRLDRPAGDLRRPAERQQVDAVLARHRHQRGALVDVDVAPLGRRQPAPVRQQEAHAAGPLPGVLQAQAPGDCRDAAVRAEDPAGLDPFARAEHDTAHRVVRRARAQQPRDLLPEAHLRAGGCRDADQGGVQHDPPDAGAAVVATDGREVARHLVPQHPPAEPHGREPVLGREPPHDAEPVEAVQGVREHHVGGDGVAREAGPVDQQDALSRTRQQGGQSRPGAAGADHDRVVPHVHHVPSLVAVLTTIGERC
jgi:hypothetical protein